MQLRALLVKFCGTSNSLKEKNKDNNEFAFFHLPKGQFTRQQMLLNAM